MGGEVRWWRSHRVRDAHPHPESLGTVGFTPLLGSPVTFSAREGQDALGPQDDHASESALLAVLEGA